MFSSASAGVLCGYHEIHRSGPGREAEVNLPGGTIHDRSHQAGRFHVHQRKGGGTTTEYLAEVDHRGRGSRAWIITQQADRIQHRQAHVFVGTRLDRRRTVEIAVRHPSLPWQVQAELTHCPGSRAIAIDFEAV